MWKEEGEAWGAGGGIGREERRKGKKTTWWNSAISSEPICKISRWKSNSYYVFISTSAYLLNEEETDQTGRESLQEPITANGSQLSAKSDAPSHCAFFTGEKKENGMEGRRARRRDGRWWSGRDGERAWVILKRDRRRKERCKRGWRTERYKGDMFLPIIIYIQNVLTPQIEAKKQ